MRYSCNETHGRYSMSNLGYQNWIFHHQVKWSAWLRMLRIFIHNPHDFLSFEGCDSFLRYPAPCYERWLARYSSLLNQSGSWRSILISRTVCTGAYAARYHSPFQFSTFMSVASCIYELPSCGTRLWLWIMGNIHGRFISSRIRLHYSWSFTFPVRGWGCYAPQGKNIFTQSVSIR